MDSRNKMLHISGPVKEGEEVQWDCAYDHCVVACCGDGSHCNLFVKEMSRIV